MALDGIFLSKVCDELKKYALSLRVDKVQQPISENVPVYEKYFRLYDEIYPAVKEKCAKLAKL